MPACATRPIQERFSGGIARYQGSVSSIRAIACAARLPDDFSRRFSVAACPWAWGSGAGAPGRPPGLRWAGGAGSLLLASRSGTAQECLIGTVLSGAGSNVEA
ncbi:hypothetical protein Sm713_35020 [Streptomyces sp. TS71-3]|nr:hypothetical protein Sm713_35020 [Streptomyces sp. TS71-3]